MAHSPYQPDAPARVFFARTLAGASGWYDRPRLWGVCNLRVDRSKPRFSRGVTVESVHDPDAMYRYRVLSIDLPLRREVIFRWREGS